MTINQKLNAIKKWEEHGGARGEAIRILHTEMDKALFESSHPLHDAAHARQNGDEEKAQKLINLELCAALQNPNSVLYQPAFFMIQIPLALVGAMHAEEQGYADPKEETFFDMARIGFYNLLGKHEGYRASKSSGGKGRAKKYDSRNRMVISEWEDYQSKEKGVNAFALWLFVKLGGDYDKDGKTLKGTPSVRAIAKIISGYLKTNSQSSK